MKRAFTDQNIEAPGWTTPWLEFWKADQYAPPWVMYLEVVLLIIIIVAVWRYRPLRFNYGRDRRYDDKGKIISKTARASNAARPGRGGRPGAKSNRRR